MYEKALIKPESYQESSDNERVIKGNAAQYPDAYIEFRLKVETPEAAKAAAAAIKKPSNPAKKTMTSQITKSRAQNILLATQQPGSARSSYKPFGDAPWMSRQVSIREDDAEHERRTSIVMPRQPDLQGFNDESEESDEN
jgi:hypothetical protein